MCFSNRPLVFTHRARFTRRVSCSLLVLALSSLVWSCSGEKDAGPQTGSPRGSIVQVGLAESQVHHGIDSTQLENNKTDATLTPVRPRGLIMGDSMMQFGIGPALKSGLEAKGFSVVYFVKKSTGLTWTHFFDWQAKSKELLAQGPFQTIVVMLGSNDGRWLKYNGKRLEYGPDVNLWWQQYEIRFDEFYGRLCSASPTLFWIGMPPMRPEGYHKKTRLFNQFYQRKIAASGCGKYIDTNYLSTDRSVRWTDGIHVTNSGGKIVASHIMKSMGL